MPKIDQTTYPSNWKEQLEFYSQNSKKGENEISLAGYTYKGKIESRSEIFELIDRMLSKESVMAVRAGDDSYELLPIGQVMTLIGEEHFTTLRSQLASTITVGMELLELKWRYKGGTYTDIAVVCEEMGGIIYDNVAHLMEL